MSEVDFEVVAMVDDLPADGLLPVRTEAGERVCLVRRGDTITAVSDVCTHQDFAISLGDLSPDGTVQCAWHGARFDCRTGAVEEGPAIDPLPVYSVRVENGRILIGPLQHRHGAKYETSAAPIHADESTSQS